MSFFSKIHRPVAANSDEALADEHIYPAQMFALPDRGSGERKVLTVQLAETDDQRSCASNLINRRYGWRGYGACHAVSATATHMTFVASIDTGIVGTITLGVDSDAGLAADGIFRDEINTYRRVPGTKCCELTKLAFDADMPSKPLLAALFHIVFIYGYHEHRCTDLFIEVNPRHRHFYQAMLGFKPIGAVKTNQSVNAPAQLMRLKVADIRAQIDEHAGRTCQSIRSLYPFFFSQEQESGIFARLVSSQPNRAVA